MCCFSRPVKIVSSTHIFARRASAERQFLVYSVNLTIDEPLAMVLPLPVPPDPTEDALRFIDLGGYADFFTDMQKGFPVEYLLAKSQGLLRAPPRQAPTLVVHEFGPFEASFVPTLSDFDRLDARFKLPAGVWDALPTHKDHGFAVFQLRALHRGFFAKVFRKATAQTIQPMAFEFATRDPVRLFYPTVHVHDGEVHPMAHFDHALYAQIPHGTSLQHEPAESPFRRPPTAAAALQHATGFVSSGGAARTFMKPDRAAGLIDGEAPIVRSVMRGDFDNADRWARVAVGSPTTPHA